MKMHCYFLLNIKHGASQLYWGRGFQLSSAGTEIRIIVTLRVRNRVSKLLRLTTVVVSENIRAMSYPSRGGGQSRPIGSQ